MSFAPSTVRAEIVVSRVTRMLHAVLVPIEVEARYLRERKEMMQAWSIGCSTDEPTPKCSRQGIHLQGCQNVELDVLPVSATVRRESLNAKSHLPPLPSAGHRRRIPVRERRRLGPADRHDGRGCAVRWRDWRRAVPDPDAAREESSLAN